MYICIYIYIYDIVAREAGGAKKRSASDAGGPRKAARTLEPRTLEGLLLVVLGVNSNRHKYIHNMCIYIYIYIYMLRWSPGPAGACIFLRMRMHARIQSSRVWKKI